MEKKSLDSKLLAAKDKYIIGEQFVLSQETRVFYNQFWNVRHNIFQSLDNFFQQDLIPYTKK